MNSLRTVWSSIRSLLQRREVKREIDEELRFHLDQRTAENIAAGMSPKDAAREARKRFGNFQTVREECRQARGASFGETLWQDIQFGLRMLRKHPGFTAVAVGSLALGIGANSAMFSVVESVLLRPLPYPDPARLAWFSAFYPVRKSATVVTPEFLSWRNQSRTLEEIAACSGRDYDLTGVEVPERLQGAAVTASFLRLLGVRPELGRIFLTEEDQPGGPRAILLSHALWQRLFSSNPRVLGTAVTLGGVSHIVVGVLPADFQFPDDMQVDLLSTLATPAEPDWNAGGFGAVSVLGRMKPGVTLEQARTELELISRRADDIVSPAFARTRAGLEVRAISLHDRLVGDVRLLLLVLSGAALFILLIACANVAHLVMARSTVRQKEIILRAAIGASRRRLVRQLLTESALLAALGAVAGLVLATAVLTLFRKLGGATIPFLDRAALNGAVLAFTAAAAAAAVFLVGLAPAVMGTRLSLSRAFQETGHSTTMGRRQRGFRGLLMAGEVALAVVLLVSAGLLIRSFAALTAVNPGFRPDHVLTLQFGLPMNVYSQPQQCAEFARQAEERIRALPGVRVVGVTSQLPLTGFFMRANVPIEGQTEPMPGQSPSIPLGAVSPDYFRALGIRLIAGRFFEPAETASAQSVAIINESFARQFFPGEDPVGRRIMGQGGSGWRVIVGVVADVHHLGLTRDCSPEVFLPFAQSPLPNLAFVVRTESDPLAMTGAVRRSMAGVDRNLPVYDVATMEERLAASIASQRCQTIILAAFAVVALSLAALGVYGVMQYVAGQRTREIGIRIALGAQRADVLKALVGDGLKLTATGLTIGLVGAFAAARILRSLLFNTNPTDPLTFLCVTLFLASIAALACWVPAHRATRIDPMTALRCD